MRVPRHRSVGDVGECPARMNFLLHSRVGITSIQLNHTKNPTGLTACVEYMRCSSLCS